MICSGSIGLFIIHAAPNRQALASVNGIAQMVGTICRALGPIVATSLYSASLQGMVLDGYMVYAVLLVLSVGGITASTMLPRTTGDHN